MDTKELTGLIISERLSLYFSRNRENAIKKARQSEEFQKLLEKEAPALTGEFERYLDNAADLGMADKESIYLFDIHDGIRLMRDIISAG